MYTEKKNTIFAVNWRQFAFAFVLQFRAQRI